jgi:hypothetical protein
MKENRIKINEKRLLTLILFLPIFFFAQTVIEFPATKKNCEATISKQLKEINPYSTREFINSLIEECNIVS